MMKIEPATLTGRAVRLEPLQMKHAVELYEVGQDQTIWTYLPINMPDTLAKTEQWITTAIQGQETGICQPFAIIDIAQGRVVGSTRYLSFTTQDRGLEIGWTWLAPSVQRTGINTECKYLLLCYAFESLDVIRVQLKTHHLNFKSQRAMERIGATKEGVLRNHMIMPDGSYRHSVFYSIINSEWPQVKKGLEVKLLH